MASFNQKKYLLVLFTTTAALLYCYLYFLDGNELDGTHLLRKSDYNSTLLVYDNRTKAATRSVTNPINIDTIQKYNKETLQNSTARSVSYTSQNRTIVGVTFTESVTTTVGVTATESATTTIGITSTESATSTVGDSSTERVTTAISIDSDEFIVNNPGCKIPKLDPLHPTVKHLIKHLPDLNCNGFSYVTMVNNTLQVNAPTDVNCFIQSIDRRDEDHFDFGRPVLMKNGNLRVSSEFVKVECKSGSNVVYRQFFPFVFHKESVQKRIQDYKQKQKPVEKEHFRIIMLGLDSVSKNQFLRHMLKTFDFMKQKLIYSEIHGYNKIGKNTYANIVPMFTGKLEYEVPDSSKQPADLIPFIWKEFMENGYKTQFSEDLPQGSIFNYGRKGFTEPPADYYLRPWSLAVEPYISKWKTGCHNEKIEANVILKYMEDLFDSFPGDPLFAFTFLTRMSHDYINDLSYHDKPVRDFLERLYLKGHLNNTFMFFFGDHGFRFGNIRATYVGRMEGRLPFMFVIVPPWFPTKYPQMFKNLKSNERRLATPLDIYATLRDLLHFDGKGFEDEGSGRSISLLKHPLPVSRTCEDASIKSQWCACVKSEPISIDDKRVKLSASEIVKKINSITEEYRSKCAELSLVSILSASKHDVGIGEDVDRDGYSNFLVTLQVSPSEGVFEGSVWYNGKSSYSADNTIERINLYKNQSACVDRNVLKPYCFCTVQVK